jgi:hypothetical protein
MNSTALEMCTAANHMLIILLSIVLVKVILRFTPSQASLKEIYFSFSIIYVFPKIGNQTACTKPLILPKSNPSSLPTFPSKAYFAACAAHRIPFRKGEEFISLQQKILGASR